MTVSHQKHHAGGEFIPETFLALLLLCALLLLAVLGPPKAPPLDKLTEFLCDTPPVLPDMPRPRGTSLPFYYMCRSEHQSVHLGVMPLSANSRAWRDCRQNNGTVRIWRPAFPTPYGGDIFQVSCNGAVMLSYEDASASYEARRAFVAIIAWNLLALSAFALVLRGIHLMKRKQRDKLIES